MVEFDDIRDDLQVHTGYSDGSNSAYEMAEAADEIGVDPAYTFPGGNRGWVGDVPRFRLSVERVAVLGWDAGKSSDAAVRKAMRELL